MPAVPGPAFGGASISVQTPGKTRKPRRPRAERRGFRPFRAFGATAGMSGASATGARTSIAGRRFARLEFAPQLKYGALELALHQREPLMRLGQLDLQRLGAAVAARPRA